MYTFNFLFRCIWFTIMAFFNNSVKLYYTAWRKVIRKAWCLHFTTHCRFLHTINNSLPIDVQLEKRCLKFLHSCLNSSNEVVIKVFLYHQSNKVFQHLVRIIVICVINIRLCLICLDQISSL